jgi:hypothetical protein
MRGTRAEARSRTIRNSIDVAYEGPALGGLRLNEQIKTQQPVMKV